MATYVFAFIKFLYYTLIHVYPTWVLYMLQVRKEKLGDRITALQQLVSPFGKVSDPGLNLVNGPALPRTTCILFWKLKTSESNTSSFVAKVPHRLTN